MSILKTKLVHCWIVQNEYTEDQVSTQFDSKDLVL